MTEIVTKETMLKITNLHAEINGKKVLNGLTLEVTHPYSEFMASPKAMNNLAAVEVHDCPVATQCALQASRNAAPLTIKMEPAE